MGVNQQQLMGSSIAGKVPGMYGLRECRSQANIRIFPELIAPNPDI
jgi:hypothetical protein